MYREYVREMNEAERRVLHEWLRTLPVSVAHTARRSLLWAGGGVLLMVFAAVLCVLVHNPVAFTAGGILAVAGLVCLLLTGTVIDSHLRQRRYFGRFQRDTAPLIRQALERGKVKCRQVTARSVIRIEAGDDEGDDYIFDPGDGNSLLLKGQECYPVDDEMPWPSDAFEIVRDRGGESPAGHLFIRTGAPAIAGGFDG